MASYNRTGLALWLLMAGQLAFGPAVTWAGTAGGSLTVAEGITVHYPDGWSVAPKRYANTVELLNVPAQRQSLVTAGIARIVIGTEPRRDHAEAVRRLKEIAAETNVPSTFLNICGWPALQRRYVVPMEQPGPDALPSGETSLRVTTAVAVGRSVVRLQGALPPNDSPAVADQMETIGRGLTCSPQGNAEQVEREIQELRMTPTPRPAASQPAVQRAAPAEHTAKDSVAASSTGAALQVQTGRGEIEMSVSTNGQYIVMAANSGYAFSTDGGGSFTAVPGGTPFPPGYFLRNGDPSLAFGVSTNFYYGFIAFPTGTQCSTTIGVSTDNGATFGSFANATLCDNNNGPTCFPDQEHIAADRFNAAGGNDQVYSTWRNFSGGNCNNTAGPVIPTIVCSTDSSATFPTSANVGGGTGDYPRITVGQDGFVYVVYRQGNNVMLDKFASCGAGTPLQLQAGFPSLVTAVTDVVCPVPGLDRCNNGNRLSSHTVAVDDTNANHIYVAYGNDTGGGNVNIMVIDSTDGGVSWGTPVQINGGGGAVRFMPWACSQGGAARVAWYDRRAAVGGASNDLTDYYCGSAAPSGGSLVAGTETNVTQNPDPQCASGWPCSPRNPFDSENCSVQPQLAGTCKLVPTPNPGTSTNNACDFSDCGVCFAGFCVGTATACASDAACARSPSCTCPATENCQLGGGCPKYGDYNGDACGVGRVFTAWSSATAPSGLPAPGTLAVFFSSKLAGPAPDLDITKADSPDPVIAGTNLTYTITVTNNGPASALNVTVTDSTPPNTTFVSASGTGFSCPTTPSVGGTGAISCTKAFMAISEVATLTIVVNVNADTPNLTVIVNTACVASDDTTAEPSTPATTTVNTEADVEMISKTDSPDPVIAGTDLTYTISGRNNGPSDAQSFTIADPLPAGTTFVSVTPSSGAICLAPLVGDPGIVSCTWAGGTAPGVSRSATIVAHVLPSVPDGAVLSNTATASSTTTDPTPGNESQTATTDVITRADLSITKSDAPDPVLAGNTITYTITSTNNGPSDAQDVVIADTIPSNTRFVSSTPSSGGLCTDPPLGGSGTVTCNYAGATAPMIDRSVTIVVRVCADVACGAVVSDTATTSSSTTDPDPSNNTSLPATTDVQTQSDLTMIKTGTPDMAYPGQHFSYYIKVTNNGPSSSVATTVVETMPVGFVVMSVTPTQGSCSGAGTGAVTCNLGTLGAAAQCASDPTMASILITTGVPPNQDSGPVMNTATVSSGNCLADSNAGDNTAQATTIIVPVPAPVLDRMGLLAQVLILLSIGAWSLYRVGRAR